MRDELPPITTFPEPRAGALPIALQNRFFELFEELLQAASKPRSRPGLTMSALRP